MIADRIKEILNHYGLTAAEFAERLNIQKSSISHLLSGRNKPSFSFISKLATNFPEINLHWFITGEGDIFNQPGQNIKYENLSEKEKTPKPRPDSTNATQKKLTDEKKSSVNQVENIIMVYDNDTFKILSKSTPSK
jgi:transcriptional regulator with XRE-family HTH domain